MWTDPDTPAARQVAAYRDAGRFADAARIERIAREPQATWLTGANPGPEVRRLTTAATVVGRTPVLVAYHIPHRDCGAFSAGGADSSREYRAYVDSFAEGLGDRSAWVILEPDAVPQALAGCANAGLKERLGLLAYAVDRLKAHKNVRVYVDAGHPGWISDLPWLARALNKAGLPRADGFSLNVSNFHTTPTLLTYARRLAQATGHTPHFVFDTSRNGNGPYTGPDPWCNPPSRTLGPPPTLHTNTPSLDAHLWIKRPGESDGTCRGGPPAGVWWPEYALSLTP
ncbi:glycoside hydrolase family 6 protein [Streptomyces roseirectus]|uniref:glycoside hydrolase family 6 protein n=1 Tax=Streptomyces roseirectus TaxID=2768066 RepID=UPI001FE45D47|nr:glycoside hydrolase family 6 protein [Streptomyces roseirectus]